MKVIKKAKLRLYQWIYSIEAPFIMILTLFSHLFLKLDIVFYILPILIFVVIPYMDYKSPIDISNPEDIKDEINKRSFYFKLIVFSYVPLQFLANIFLVFFFIS